MKAILTTIGKDQVGIIAGVSQFLAEKRLISSMFPKQLWMGTSL